MELVNKEELRDSVKLIRSSKGVYYWEIKVGKIDNEKLVEEVMRIDKELKEDLKQNGSNIG